MSVSYCQGMGVIVATLLLFLEEEDAFWLTAAIVEDLLPASYYSSTLLGTSPAYRAAFNGSDARCPGIGSARNVRYHVT